ncbi:MULTISPECIES: tyrosine-type recombinase/integrase [unclassified Fusibacter]|uniref:tyrosine-type recombinase/integrase n=1 Tax=unclassified Fusibacter TaxID=2624464 RepID=UPI0010104595|nr:MULTISPECIES: tyrosine-type recombinase/integrase [unclassified Fusibacter]MCK8058840.1 tyrosine-type recombinase/integrase [Fusibacter sp. A2]NPE21914.1 tyrosine-type recombinase/integrase [Fusibacter sp. A1]RXV61484.1 recombinase [Fusibacter sp. A1]
MKRETRVHNKTSRPDNLVIYESELKDLCASIESQMPDYLYDYFIFLKSAVALTTRHAYLSDLLFFFKYLVKETLLTKAELPIDIPLSDIAKIKAKDVNRFIGDYCSHYELEKDGVRYVMENRNRSLSRKKSAISVFFKFIFREEMIPVNITTGFNPIRLPKPQPDAIKRLAIEEVATMISAVEKGTGLTEKERVYWERTKYRDKAILVLFTTYGLRLKELQQLNLSSFNFTREEFMIYRKRGKEVLMPINKTAQKVITDYLTFERAEEEKLDADSKDALFLSLQMTRMTERAIRNLVKKYTSIAMNTSRNQGYSPHKLRATAASSLIEYGFSIYDVQNLMDHDNITTTQLYAAHRKHAKRDILENYELLE